MSKYRPCELDDQHYCCNISSRNSFFCFLMDGWRECVPSLACTVMRTIMILDQWSVSLMLCLAVMTVSFIQPPDDGACEDCHPSCESCSGEEKNQCTKCAQGQSVSHVARNSSFIFSWLQPQRWWCLLFLPPPGRFLTTQQTCVSKCPGGFFASRLSGVCESCPPGCLQCVDAQRCSRCQSTRKAQYFLQDGQCVQECVRWRVHPVLFFVS